MKRYKPYFYLTRQQERIIYRLLNLSNKKLKESSIDYAEQQLKKAGLFDQDSDYNGMVGKAVLELIQTFSNQQHSGYSAPLVISLFDKLANFEPIAPIDNPMITGAYEDISKYSDEPVGKSLQSTELSKLFSHDYGKTWYGLVEVFQGDGGCTYEKKYITSFPFVYNKNDFRKEV
jgi:hypothetical protein